MGGRDVGQSLVRTSDLLDFHAVVIDFHGNDRIAGFFKDVKGVVVTRFFHIEGGNGRRQDLL